MDTKENEKVERCKNSIYLEGFKNVVISSIIYFIGYMNWSITWIIIPIVISMFNEERRRKNLKRRNLVREAALGSEQDVILENVGDLPAWVYFPDIERAEWINRIIKQLWPNVNHYVRNLIANNLEEKLKRNLEKYSMKGFKFQRVVLGSVPFRIGGVIVYENVSRDEIVMDLDISYAGDCDIKFQLRGLTGGLKNFQLYGKLRIVLKPLIKNIPLAGGLQAFFLVKPDIDFDLDGIAGILQIPGINNVLKKGIVETVSSLMVLPNKFPIKLSKEVNSMQLKTPNPAGVLRVHVIEAKDLVKKDITFTGKGKSDPYTILEVGDQSFRTQTIDCTVNPKWDYWCEFIILEFSGQQLSLHVWDEDTTEDETLGKVSLDISNLIKVGQSDMWLALEGVKHGQIHVRCTWLILSTDYSDLQVAIYETQQLQLTYMSTAVLIAYVDSATNLPHVKASNKPDPCVQIQIGKQIKCTKALMRTVNPVWEEGFIFFVSNPDSDALDLKVFDAKTESELCSLTYNVSNLSNKEHLEIVQQPFRLAKGTSESKIVWSLHLKILKNENLEEYLEGLLLERRQSNSSTSSKFSSLGYIQNQIVDDASLFNNIKLEEYLDNNSKSSTRSSVRSNSSYLTRRSKSKSSDEPALVGQINLSLRYSVQRQRLIVIVHSLSNILYREEGINLYVKVYLLPERSKEVKRKTGVINSNNPTFDETFEYLISQGELASRKLEISVIEERKMKNYILGEVFIDLAKLDILKTHTDWFELGPHLKKD